MAWTITSARLDAKDAGAKVAAEKARLEALKGAQKLPADVLARELKAMERAALQVEYVAALLGPAWAACAVEVTGDARGRGGFSVTVAPPPKPLR